MTTDVAYEQLAQRYAELEQEKAELAEILDRTETDRDTLAEHAEAVADAVGLLSHNLNRRNTGVITTCIYNAMRFARYLHAIEDEFMMVPGEPDEDFPDIEPDDECLVNSWGARCTENYVEQFREALTRRDAEQKAEALESLSRRKGPNGDDAVADGFTAGWDAAFETIDMEAIEYRRQAAGGQS